ncbi:MAG: metallopeptidase family protein [Alphaproteobacteria bacterium]|nr:metallopeptidase family protein [Alphaproteobacteria bacterium]
MISAVLGETGEGLARLVRHRLIHKIGDHFGFSEEDIDRIEAATD